MREKALFLLDLRHQVSLCKKYDCKSFMPDIVVYSEVSLMYVFMNKNIQNEVLPS